MKKKIPFTIIEFEKENYHILVESILPDGNTGYWAIDTGASKTVFDKNLCQKYGIEPIANDIQTAGIGGLEFEVETGHIGNIMFGKYTSEILIAAIIDLSHINTMYLKADKPAICGLIGSDFLVKHNALIDYREKHLILRK
jgi:hypothetical protein